MVRAMLKCEQTKGQSVYQHGQSVLIHYQEIVESLKNQKTLSNEHWRLPEWLSQYRRQILENLHDQEITSLYALYHDCGKPYCRTVDNLGRVHFPNHADVSASIWELVGCNPTVGKLIRHDMDIHTLTAQEIAHRCVADFSKQDAVTLSIMALAEVHSNARLFGGIDSVSFKSKCKKVCQRGKQICQFWF
jgi:hypothetical protein